MKIAELCKGNIWIYIKISRTSEQELSVMRCLHISRQILELEKTSSE